MSEERPPKPEIKRPGRPGVFGLLDNDELRNVPTKQGKRSSSSRFLGLEKPEQLEKLPELKSLPYGEREAKFIMKIKQCRVIFDFFQPLEGVEQKEIKRDVLLELVEYILTESGIFTPNIYKELVDMVSANLFRPLPPRLNPSGLEYDPEEDDPILEAAWPHVQLVYELFLRFIESPEFDVTIAKKHIDTNFIDRLLELFDSEDPREREYLKTTLHRIYGKFLSYRAYIRSAIKIIFLTFSYETQTHNGIAELLEILGSIINGFALPLRDEHKEFLFQALMPLHKPRSLGLYHAHLSYCVAQFIEKDPSLIEDIFKKLLSYWPYTDTAKEQLFITEVEEILCVIDPPEFQRIQVLLFKKLSQCMCSNHFQIAEKSLHIWNNDYILSLVAENFEVILPIIFPSLYNTAKHHWNNSIKTMATNSLQILLNIDEQEFNKVVNEYNDNIVKEKSKTDEIINLWKEIVKDTNSSKLPSSIIIPSLQFDHCIDTNDPILSDSTESTYDDNRAFKQKELLPMDHTTINALLDHHIKSHSSSTDSGSESDD